MSAKKKRRRRKLEEATRPKRKLRRYPRAIVEATKVQPPPPNGEPLTAPESAAAAAQAREIAEANLHVNIFRLKSIGYSFRRIAAELKVSSGYAHKVVDEQGEQLATVLGHTREVYRALDLDRCDGKMAQIEALLRAKPSVGLFFAYLGYLNRRAKLLGLDMPTKFEFSRPGDERDLTDAELEERGAAIRDQVEEARARIAAAALQQSQTPERA